VSAVATPRDERLLAATGRLRRAATAERRWTSLTIALGAAIVLGILLLGLAAPLLGFKDPNQQHLNDGLQPPSLDHLFGTDSVGRDVFTRVLHATRLDYQIAIVTTYVPLAIGVGLGALAGYLGGWIDAVIMRIVDIVIAFPMMIFVIAFVAISGPGLAGIYVGLIAFQWALYARLTRAEMLVLRERQYISAAKTLGFSTPRVLFKHALPNLLRPNLVFSMATIVLNILLVASLSYLGLGVKPNTPEWGSIIADGQNYLFTQWWLATLPGLVVVLVGLGFSLLGDGISDRLGYEFRLTT
jgi:peptide/nickel transport system permease protein